MTDIAQDPAGYALAGLPASTPDAAELLSARGFDQAMVSAALLHDADVGAALGVDQIARRFGAEVGDLVAGLTEDRRIARYPARKAEARTRAIRDRRVATIYTADKLANTRRLLAADDCVDGERLDHYVKTLRLFSEQLGDLPFLAELSVELTKLIDRDADRIGLPSPGARRAAWPSPGRTPPG